LRNTSHRDVIREVVNESAESLAGGLDRQMLEERCRDACRVRIADGKNYSASLAS
jgi:hypothetical protein